MTEPATPETRKPMDVRCEPCGHVWTALWLPMPIMDAAAIMKGLRCPNCAAGSNAIYAVPEADRDEPA